MRRLFQPALLIFGIAIILMSILVAAARREEPETPWLFYRHDDVLYRLDLESGKVEVFPSLYSHIFAGHRRMLDSRWLIYEQNSNLYRRDHIGHTVQQITHFSQDSVLLLWFLWEKRLVMINNDTFYVAALDGTNLRQLGDVLNFDILQEFSHNSKKFLFSTLEIGNSDIFVVNLEAGDIRQLTDFEGDAWNGRWSLDDEWILFSSNQNGERGRFQIRPDGSDMQVATQIVKTQSDGHISPDGQWILVDYEYPVGLMRSDGSEFIELTNIPNLGNSELFAVWSADSSGFITAAEIEGDEDKQEFYWNSIDGSERHLIENSTLPRVGISRTAISPDRSAVVYEVSFNVSADTELVLLPTNGDPMVQLTTEYSQFVAWSPNSEWIIIELIVGECCFPHNHSNELFRMYLEDGRIERLTYTGEDEYPIFMGFAPMVEMEWDWWVMVVGGILALAGSLGISLMPITLDKG